MAVILRTATGVMEYVCDDCGEAMFVRTVNEVRRGESPPRGWLEDADMRGGPHHFCPDCRFAELAESAFGQ